MGPITDHSFENLASSDLMIVVTRRRLLKAATVLAENGTLPPGAEGGETYGRMRGGFQRVGNPRMAGRLSFAARRGGRPKHGGGGGIIADSTIIDVRGGVNASALCLHHGRSRGVWHAWARPFEFSNEQLKPVRWVP
jgi:hypothetical protein